MNLKFFICLLSILLLQIPKTSGQAEVKRLNHSIETKFEKCLSADSNQNTASMIQCTINAIKEWDNELNNNYQLLMTTLSLEDKEKLKIAQRAWLSFYEKEKKFISSLYSKMNGTMWQLIAANETLELIKTRALQLKNYYEMHQLNK